MENQYGMRMKIKIKLGIKKKKQLKLASATADFGETKKTKTKIENENNTFLVLLETTTADLSIRNRHKTLRHFAPTCLPFETAALRPFDQRSKHPFPRVRRVFHLWKSSG